MDCLSEASPVEETPARRRHQDLVTRWVDLLNDDRNGPLTIETIGAMLGISERGLRVAFQEQLGMALAAYLRLRRMHLVHRALRSRDPAPAESLGAGTALWLP